VFLKLTYNSHFFYFLSSKNAVKKWQKTIFKPIGFILRLQIFSFFLILIERILAIVLWLPIPLYSSVIYSLLKNLKGFTGYYFRGLYYSIKAKKWSSNIIVEEGVILENIGNYSFDEFTLIDKNVVIYANEINIGKHCHIGIGVIISPGGSLIMEDYAAISFGSIIITSSDNPKGGFRTSGPMIPDEDRNVKNGTIILRKDSWVSSNVVIYPGVEIEEGAIISPNSVIGNKINSWSINIPQIKYMKLSRDSLRDEIKNK